MPDIKMEKDGKPAGAAHPKVSVMVETAIKTLAERKGSSMQAINKFIGANYSVDVKKLSTHIKKALKAAVDSGDIVQTSGKGATGSFKIGNKKPMAKPQANKLKLEKPHKMSTSTPMKTLKSKKALVKSPNKSPVQKTYLAGDQEMTSDATFTKPSKVKKPRYSIPSKSRKSKVSLPMKVKKPKKLLNKAGKQPKAAASLKETPDDTATSSKPAKVKDVKKSTKTKKSPKPRKPASNVKKNVSK